MKSTRYLLIGGGLACNEAAKQIRKLDTDGAITMVGDEPHLPYNRPPLSKDFLTGKKPLEKLFFSPAQFYQDNRVDIILGVAAENLNLEKKTVTLDNGDVLAFDKALVATGGQPVQLNIAGNHLKNVYYLRNLNDFVRLASVAKSGTRAVLIGAGFIGMEVAASLTELGVKATVIERGPHIWSRFLNKSVADFFQSYCGQKGIAFVTNDSVAEIKGTDHVESVLLKSGKILACDFVCISIGIVPNLQLARDADLEVENGVIVNEHLQTSHQDVFAAGDIANYPDPVFGKRRRVEHWGHAFYCGQLAGKNMVECAHTYDHLTSVWSNIFDLSLSFAGDETEYDQILYRGNFDARSFFVFYLKQNVMTAYFAVNAPPVTFAPIKSLISIKKNIRGKEAQLQDLNFELKGLV